MSRQDQVDEDVERTGRAIAALRDRYGVTQEQAAEAHEKEDGSGRQFGITKQYWSMHETGRVPGIVKPATQRKLLTAISRAANLDQPLTLQDLAEEMAAPQSSPQDARALRMSQAFGPPSRTPTPPTGRQAVFPTSAGDVVVQLPPNMTPEAFGELEAYLAVFMKANLPRD